MKYALIQLSITSNVNRLEQENEGGKSLWIVRLKLSFTDLYNF
jgi:hypothetical protein